ncbi:microtubule-destabilizing protein 60-like isoform X2 [Phragmites australis]|uniref:microtubule-destabilizing protein 60-like isoform X2 n=1 Tax=Phragmites australis TaxID=29695 RepID=UPI002D7786C0|nr:microtubule-destabilizing protein 60-like isoform X2 [Phragmites australis]
MATAAAKTPTKPLAPVAAAKTPTKPLAPAAAAKTPTKPLVPSAAARTPTKPLAPATGATPTKAAAGCSSSRARFSHASENSHPNIPLGTPTPQSTPSKPAKSPAATGAKSASAKKKPSTPAPMPPPPPRERERRFVVAKKGARRRRNVATVGGGGSEIDFDKCREAAREALRASQEEFFRKERAASTAVEEQLGQEEEEEKTGEEDVKGGALEEVQEGSEAELEGSSKVRALRTKAMAKAMSSVPDPGAGRVKHLVEAFESLLTISGATSDADRAGEGSWALPGLQPWKEEESEGDLGLPPVSMFSSADFLNAGPNRLCTSFDGNSDRLSWDSRTSAGGRKSRRNTSESLRSSWNKKLKVTSQHPFKLRTEQRGRAKKQQFVQKVQEMLMEEEKKRIHIAQGLPWTTDEPECLLKPPVKERTEPIDLVLHSDVRAVERAEFDQYVLERNKFAEQLRLERERQQELEDQERIRQLRKELVPKAQPMPYFDRPFIPKRSAKPATVPMEPKFHPRPEKLSCNSSWSPES